MTSSSGSKFMAPASVVTPQKSTSPRDGLAAIQPRRLSGSSPSTSKQQQQGPEQQPKRVFRCLSNTRGNHHGFSPISPDRRSHTPSRHQQQQLQQQSSLKHMFQPPTPNSRKKPSSPREERKREVTARVQGSRLDRSTLYHVPLRRSRPTRASTSTTATSNESDVSQNKKIHFQPIVAVVAIPSHREYSSNTKKTLWGSMKEIKTNAVRNTAEFIHDRCNWRKATEEQDMYRDSRNGVLIHPVHVQRYYAALQAHEEKKKQKEQEQQEEESENQATEEEEPSRSSRKRARCCSPSPIRRARSARNPDYEHHEAKRRRLHIHVPVPCRPVYYCCEQQQHYPYGHMQQQENMGYYHQQYPVNHYEYGGPMYPMPFPHHPSRNCPTTEMA
ncbi:expressed unknown protein [Seminavis robusta]|uniref:Uncharacterized protein n=1 Tax=Seminavis robusta TaxID=568900 RepID=A0A9N8HFZ8_9STRA|nr:expressed unknown protein [Seminavis robusta]|eukprot:Sro483_g152070.1 n/a (387) ;mRNA; r:34526-35686